MRGVWLSVARPASYIGLSFSPIVKFAADNRRMEMQRYHRLFLAVCASLTFAPGVAHAQAFGLNEIGSCAFSRGFAATSAPCNDASSIFWNPAATAGLKGNTILAGAAVIAVNAKFTRDSALGSHKSDISPAMVPHIFLNHTQGNMALGLGVYAPYGLTSQWEDNFPGRFLAKKASIATVYVQPNVAISLKGGKWMFGGGPVFGHSTVELVQSADLSEQIAALNTATNPTTVTRFTQVGIAKRTEFARATLNGTATSWGLNLGGIGKLNDKWTFGFRYLSSQIMKYDEADATFEQKPTGIVLAAGNTFGPGGTALPAGTLFDTLLSIRSRFCTTNSGAVPNAPGAQTGSAQTCAAKGLLGNQKVATQITHPDQFQAGFSYTGFASWLIAVDYEWTGWRKFKDLTVNFANDSIPTFCATGAPTATCDYDVLDRVLFEDYNNTSALRVGVEKTIRSKWLIRFGFAGVASAAPDETVTPLLPEQDRTYWSLGSEYPIIKDKVTLDAAYGLVLGSGRRGRIDERLARTTGATALNSGIYDLSAHVLSLSLKASF